MRESSNYPASATISVERLNKIRKVRYISGERVLACRDALELCGWDVEAALRRVGHEPLQ